MRTVRIAVLFGALGFAGCARTISGHADNITKLEKERASHPKSGEVLRSLGIEYFKGNRLDDARSALQQAAVLRPTDGVVALYLGLTAEAQNDLPAARTAYESYMRVGKTNAVKRQIGDRLSALARKENELAAKRAIAQEQQLSTVPGEPNTVAVLPFAFSGPDTSLKPLERGFAELVTTDLSRSPDLRVVERARLQAVLDEMKLQQTSGVAAGTGVRAGKILQAGRLVGGTISQLGADQLRADAFVTNVQTTQTVGSGAGDQQSLDQLFNIEKNVVLRLFTDLGVTLTTAQRNAIEQRPTRSLAAFLAYSHGLELQDQGKFDEARGFFDNALRIDPGFDAAKQKGQESQAVVAGSAVTVVTVETGLRGTTEGAAVVAASVGAAAPPPTITTTTTATATAQSVNSSSAAGATASGPVTGTVPVVTAATGTGGNNPTTKAATVTVTVKQPHP